MKFAFVSILALAASVGLLADDLPGPRGLSHPIIIDTVVTHVIAVPQIPPDPIPCEPNCVKFRPANVADTKPFIYRGTSTDEHVPYVLTWRGDGSYTVAYHYPDGHVETYEAPPLV